MTLFDQAIGESLADYSDRLESFFDGSYLGAPTGLLDLDELTYGLHGGKLYLIGARPAMGKSALALNILREVTVGAKRPGVMFSLEMDQMELVERLACSDARIDSQKLKRGDITEHEWAKFSHAFARLLDAPIYISDESVVNIKKITEDLARFKEEMGDLGVIVIDYVQLMSGDESEGRQQEVSKISRSLKLLARALDVPVVILSQLNRKLEDRVDKRPMLSDLRESGSLEQDADVVMFIYRDEVYNPDSEAKGTAEIIVAKHRGGPNGTVKAAWLAHCTKFANMAKAD